MIFLCRWENGDFSVVDAEDKMDAIIKLDEVGSAAEDQLTVAEDCMIHFKLKDDVTEECEYPVELENFGEGFLYEVDDLYPVYSSAVIVHEPDWLERQRKALDEERTRLLPVNKARRKN